MSTTFAHLRRHRRRYQLGLSAVLLTLIVAMVEPRRLLGALRQAPYEWIVPWGVLYEALVVLFWAAGMRAIVRSFADVPLRTLVRSGFVLQGLTLVVPGRLGDLGLIPLLRAYLSAPQAGAAIVCDKLVTLALVAVLALAGVAYVFGGMAALLGGALLVGGVGTLCVLARAAAPAREARLFRAARARLGPLLADAGGAMKLIVRGRAGIAANLGWTLCRVVLAGASFTLVLHWFGVSVSLGYVILVQAMVQIAAMVPVTYMGIGIVEALNIDLLGRAGVDAPVILAASLAARAVQIGFYLGVVALAVVRRA